MRPKTLLTWIVLPLLPLIIGFVLLGLIDDATTGIRADLPDVQTFFKDDRDLRFFNAFLPYVAAALFHVTACAAVVVIMVLRFRELPQRARSSALVIFAATAILLVAIGLVVRVEGLNGALNLGYRYSCSVISAAGVASHVMPPDCTSGGLSWFAWFALFPVIAGLLAAALASAVTSTSFAPLDHADPAELEAELERRSALNEQTFRAVAFVLVTSTLSLAIFYRLPLALIENAGAAGLWTGYAQAMTLFWGVLFTLTLVCVFGAGTLMLNTQLSKADAGSAGLDLPLSLHPQANRQQLMKVLTTLAPLLVGASGSLLEAIAGAL